MTTNNQTEKICFRYDGSKDSKKALKWVNKLNNKYKGLLNYYYFNLPSINGFYCDICKPSTHRIVTPDEFLRIVTGESQWKVGDECYLASNSHYKWVIVSFHPNNLVKIAREDYEVYYLTHLLRPIRKSVRDELIDFAKSSLSPEDMADRMLNHFNVTFKDTP